MGSVIPSPAPVTYLTSSSRPEVLGINTWTSGMRDNHHHARESLYVLIYCQHCVSRRWGCDFGVLMPVSNLSIIRGLGTMTQDAADIGPWGSRDISWCLRLRVGDIYRASADVCTDCTCYYFYSHRVWGVETIANEPRVKIARSNFYQQQALDTDRGHRISAKMTPKNKLA